MTGWHRNRMYLFDHRVHHGLVGVLMVGIGIALLLDDLADKGTWIPDLITRNYPRA